MRRAGALLVMWLVVAVTVAVATVGRPVIPPPCEQEDGGPYPCVWDGPNRGTPGQPGGRTGSVVIIHSDD